MTKLINVAVLGATGVIGETILSILEERAFPVKQLFLLGSQRSSGKTALFHNKPLLIQDVAQFDFSQVQVAFFAVGNAQAAEYADKAARAGCVVIDNSSQFRYDDDVPLVIPEVNPEAIAGYTERLIIANPNCSTLPILVALKPIVDAVGITRINVATYQSVSGTGKDAIAELAEQSASILNGIPVEPRVYPKQIAFNVLPHIDVFEDNGYTREEMKMVWETQKILNNPSIRVNPTSVRVPVFYGHSAAVHIETERKITAADAKALLSHSPGVIVVDDELEGGQRDYPTPVSHINEGDAVYVGRIREDLSHERGLNLWVVADNVRKGGALNAVQIAEILVNEYLL